MMQLIVKRCFDLFAVAALVIVVACGRPQLVASRPSEPANLNQLVGKQMTDQAHLVEYLRNGGFTVQVSGHVQQPFVEPQGTDFCISRVGWSSERLQIYTYNDQRAAEADVRRIGPDGSTITWQTPDGGLTVMHNEWIAPPHFFQNDRLLVLYFGDDHTLLNLLLATLGNQVAGAPADAVAYRTEALESCHDLRTRQFRNKILGMVTFVTITGMAGWIGFQLRRRQPGT